MTPYLLEYYTSPTCLPCKTFLPLVKEQLKGLERQVTLEVIDVSKRPEAAFAAGVRTAPTLILYANYSGGPKPLRQLNGAVPEEKLKSFLLLP